jgi:hypothetical protein
MERIDIRLMKPPGRASIRPRALSRRAQGPMLP